jgi:hypothetical protein
MPEQEHPFDGIAQDLQDWMTGEVNYYVEAMRGGYRSPFSADVSEKDKLDYYRRQMYVVKPDGAVQYDQPNAAGRDKLLKSVGVQAYAEIYDAVKPKAGLRSLPDTAQGDPFAANIPTMPEEKEPVE